MPQQKENKMFTQPIKIKKLGLEQWVVINVKTKAAHTFMSLAGARTFILSYKG